MIENLNPINSGRFAPNGGRPLTKSLTRALDVAVEPVPDKKPKTSKGAMYRSKVDWCDCTWSPIVGCIWCCPECWRCFATRLQVRGDRKRTIKLTSKQLLRLTDGQGVSSIERFTGWTGAVKLRRDRLRAPLRDKAPKLIFVNLVSDIAYGPEFEEKNYEGFLSEFEGFRREIFGVIEKAHWHTFQILTKRPQLFLEPTIADPGKTVAESLPWPQNLWFGVSVGTKKSVSKIDDLRKIPAKIRWISFEPLLEDLLKLDLTGIDWVVIGGESGKSAREFPLDAARSIVAQCREQGVPVYVKQLGDDWASRLQLGRKAHVLDEWPSDLDDLKIREWPNGFDRSNNGYMK
ncbi:MAG: DUF5131 family protein [Fimbriimonadaceae bacterium]|nr:DUF5131 family protein [Fimbriimonadaceae bacterium]